jgi:hypothetical protein
MAVARDAAGSDDRHSVTTSALASRKTAGSPWGDNGVQFIFSVASQDGVPREMN